MTPISILGIDCLEQVIRYIKPMKFRKALIVTDKMLVENRLIEGLLSLLNDSGTFYIIYKDVAPNPTVAQVELGLKLYCDNGCDFLISFGGGSPHDCAKAIALLSTNKGKIHDYEGYNKSIKPSAPLIAINTTAGTGSELTRFCVITDEERRTKMTINDWHVTPIIAVNDAALMTGLPAGLTAATGMDALTHGIEAYVSTNATPVTDCKALKAVELILNHLLAVYKDGCNLEAREMMVYAEYLAGISFNNAGLGYVHAMAHQLGGFYNLPHGLCNALLLPAVMEFNLPAAAHKYADIARVTGIAMRDLSAEANARLVISKIIELNRAMGLPTKLTAVKGFEAQDIPVLAEHAIKDICCLTNPRQASVQEIEDIFKSLI
ncbi:iron-containing alcohol dehydrogenase [Sporomusa aerivorans]